MAQTKFSGTPMTPPGAEKADTHSAFRGTFTLDADAEVEIRLLTSCPFIAWLDGALWQDGPLRYPKGRYEFSSVRVRLAKGTHVLAVHLHYEGVTTRLMEAEPPFLAPEHLIGSTPIPMKWKVTPLPGFEPGVSRINPQLGWIDWCDTRRNPADWTTTKFNDADWATPASKGETPVAVAALIPPPANHAMPLHYFEEGKLAETFGYERDEIEARFFLRDLAPREVSPTGTWRRYDLDRVRLGRPRFLLDLPAGTVVEFGMSENLLHGRVSPWINLSAGGSCNLDHYVARGGVQEFMPATAKGGRFLEVHILGTTEAKFLSEQFVERQFHGDPPGRFSCEDPLLERIWQVGVDTYRACTEDALIDNPTRERGQWTGDVVTVGMDVAAVAYADLRLVRRGLVQSAACAREDGLIAGLCPGGPAFLSTYAAQWISACLHYYEATGDKALLQELYPAALRNAKVFTDRMTDDGVPDDVGWAFVDWGYVRNAGPTDMGLNLHVLAALRDLGRWAAILGHDRAEADKSAARLEAAVVKWLGDGADFDRLGFHRTVLALRLGLLKGDKAVAFVKAHYLRCFPNDASAPRLSDPGASQERLITPYFAHFALAELWERGEGDFALDQYRKCWGWALGDGRTTWLEVFDPRWSHCHQWSGCPTWQLSRYVLGLRPRFDLGERVFEFDPKVCKLGKARGRVPLATGEVVEVDYERTGSGRRWRFKTSVPIRLRVGGREVRVTSTHEETSPA